MDKRFEEMLLDYALENDASKRRDIETRLWKEFGAVKAVLILDLSGFSLLTQKYGIVHYLSMVRRMQLTVEPIIEAYDGNVLKFEADNCLAIFPDTLPAIRAGIAMQLALDASNLLTPDDLDVRIACGIDYGKILIIGNEDCFGDAVNRAYKLGEDVAAANEILVTRDAMDRVHPEADLRRRAVNISISGIAIPAYAIEYRAQE